MNDEILKMKAGDLVSVGPITKELGIVLWSHPTKEIVKVMWQDGIGWEKPIRLKIISRCNHGN